MGNCCECAGREKSDKPVSVDTLVGVQTDPTADGSREAVVNDASGGGWNNFTNSQGFNEYKEPTAAPPVAQLGLPSFSNALSAMVTDPEAASRSYGSRWMAAASSGAEGSQVAYPGGGGIPEEGQPGFAEGEGIGVKDNMAAAQFAPQRLEIPRIRQSTVVSSPDFDSSRSDISGMTSETALPLWGYYA